MKKKKQQNDVVEPEREIDLKSLIHQHSQFFDKLVELIPAKFYLSKDEDKPWFQGLSKAKRDAAKKQARENIKKARRDRLDPDKANVTTLDLLKQNLEKEKQKEESEDEEEEEEDEDEEEEEEEVEINPVISGVKDDARSATYEDLRERYKRKLEELRGERKADGTSRRQQKREERQEFRSKRKREHGSGGKKAVATKAEIAKNVEKEAEEATKELRFSHVKIGDEDDHGMMKKKRKLSKRQELEKAKELQEAKADPEKGAKESWRAATSKAAGVKVHDDPKLLKQSIKKEKKRQQKNAEKWKERVESQHKVKAGKQEKRSQNIAGRIQEKKARKIAKREKKLMRPGFEGRKEGYINEATST
ncbi:unnamed protein product [Linum tenue]|uniref:Uncharacterized protein n=1 Tax=Linum tenue TaxID=586396 RepID=A0AAV0LRW0_9ROSI|nr:unnamed protein product [Linum tenue]